MPSEEGKQVLQLLAEGKIDVEQAYRLLRALGDVEEGAPRPPRGPVPPSPSPLTSFLASPGATPRTASATRTSTCRSFSPASCSGSSTPSSDRSSSSSPCRSPA